MIIVVESAWAGILDGRTVWWIAHVEDFGLVLLVVSAVSLGPDCLKNCNA